MKQLRNDKRNGQSQGDGGNIVRKEKCRKASKKRKHVGN
jgi:hypothetical protein